MIDVNAKFRLEISENEDVVFFINTDSADFLHGKSV